MTNIQVKNIDHESKPALFAGIDVGAEELILVIRKNGKPFDPQKFANTPSDHTRLVKKLVKLPGIIVCLEATGVYHFDLSLALHDAGVLLVGLHAFAVTPQKRGMAGSLITSRISRMVGMARELAALRLNSRRVMNSA
jgi:hypothetical protein